MKLKQKKAIFDKAAKLKFEINDYDKHVFKLPLGLKTQLSIDYDYSKYKVMFQIEDEFDIINIRTIESPEDLEMLFNAICPEKHMLPFS